MFEVIQNAADAILEGAEQGDKNGRIVVRLTHSNLYVANTGAPLTKDGIVALLGANSSRKRKNQIGRFGLGFKSLLALGGKIDLFSRSASLRFDACTCGKTICNELNLPSSHQVPGLRIAEIISFEEEAASDPQLVELGQWATTVLRAEIGDTEMQRHLHDELRDFPRQFVLFLPVDLSLELEPTAEQTRHITCERLDGCVALREDDEVEEWLSVERLVRIDDDAAIKDAGRLHGRSEVPLIWAVPLSGIEDAAGRFWAFFPTDTFSRVPGIINAPWKIDFGRSALSPGDYNKTLMRAAADLVAEHIPKLLDADDPGRVLDAFPRRLEPRDEPAAPLVEALWDRLCEMAVIPDGHRELRRADELSLHPLDEIELVNQWHASVKLKDALSRFVHPSCLRRRQRIARLNELLRSRLEGELPQTELCEWLEAACAATVSDVKRCLSLVAELPKAGNWWSIKDEIRRAKIVLTRHGKLVAAKDAIIEGATEDIDGVYPVSPELLSDDEAREVLVEVLQIRNLDEEEWKRRIRQAVEKASGHSSQRDNKNWRAVWRLLRAAPPSVLEKVSDLFDGLRIRCRDGRWRFRHQVLLPGRIISSQPGSSTEEAGMTVDLETHQDDGPIFETIGITDLPRTRPYSFSKYDVSDDYNQAMWVAYRSHLEYGQRPQRSKISVGEFTAPHGWRLIEIRAGDAQAKVTQFFLTEEALRHCGHAQYGHRTRPEDYPKISVINPCIWSLLHRGTVSVSGHRVPVGSIIKYRDRLSTIPNHPFSEFEGGLTALSERIPKGYDLEDDREKKLFWLAVDRYCLKEHVSTEQRRAIYEWMAEETSAPNPC